MDAIAIIICSIISGMLVGTIIMQCYLMRLLKVERKLRAETDCLRDRIVKEMTARRSKEKEL